VFISGTQSSNVSLPSCANTGHSCMRSSVTELGRKPTVCFWLRNTGKRTHYQISVGSFRLIAAVHPTIAEWCDLTHSGHSADHADFPKAVIRAVFMYGVIALMFAG
jgi:hypothetical protein